MVDGSWTQSARQGRVVVIMGPPNAGKDTQADLLAQRMGGIHIGSGALLRQEADPRVMAIMARGELVPAEDFRRLIAQAVVAVPLERPIVLAGIAKRPEEAHWLVDYLPSVGRWLDRVILLVLSREEAIKRSRLRAKGEGREDDNPEVQGVRWDRFYEKTARSLEFFREQRVLVEVDGLGTEAEVATRIDEVLSL